MPRSWLLSFFALVAAQEMVRAAAMPYGGFLEKVLSEVEDREAFLSQLGLALGSEERLMPTLSRLGNITEALNVTFQSLPKNKHGALSSAAARYVIHRFFFQHHGWQVKGLAPAGSSWSTFSPALGMGERLPEQVRNLFEERTGRDGLNLVEIAVIAATIENLIHGEVVGRVHATYAALAQDVGGDLAPHDAAQVLDTYTAAYVNGLNISQMPAEEVASMMQNIEYDFPYWSNTQQLLREARQGVVAGRPAVSFGDVTRIAEIVNARFGSEAVQRNCEDITERLVKLDALGTGRVRLRDFYASNLNEGNWQFMERVDYLRHLGAMDDSSPVDPRIIIPNYIYMHANCLNVSSFYDACCVDKCELMLDHLEDKLRTPHATVEQILSLVPGLPTAYQPARGRLTETLTRRLEEVGRHHDGLIPLHGRLFAQWMHFAYPRECPYPHLSGTTESLTDSEWFEATGSAHWLEEHEMQKFVESAPAVAPSQDAQGCSEDLCTAMWLHEEELLDAGIAKPKPNEAQGRLASLSLPAVLRSCAFLVAIVSSAAAFRNSAQDLLGGPEKGLVRQLLAKIGVSECSRGGFMV